MSIDWLDVIKIAVSSSALVALISLGKDYVVRRATLKRDARYLAQRLAIILEKYAVDCADFIAENEWLIRRVSNVDEVLHWKLPSMDPFPLEADWKAIKPDLMDRALSMSNELALVAKTLSERISFWRDQGEWDSVLLEFSEQTGKCGLKAWMLASELRRSCGIPASTLPATSWDFVTTLRKQAEAAETQRRRDDPERRKKIEATPPASEEDWQSWKP